MMKLFGFFQIYIYQLYYNMWLFFFIIFIAIIIINLFFIKEIKYLNNNLIIVNDQDFYYINIPKKNLSEYKIIKIPII